MTKQPDWRLETCLGGQGKQPVAVTGNEPSGGVTAALNR